jgi:drug/metabolite transporter (DMT)-like permease
LTIVYALLAALCNALSEITQHKASISSPPRTRGWRVALYLFRSPLWLFGWAAIAGAFLFQALALHHGLMSVVQPLLVTELVFVLVLRRVWIGQAIRSITWWAAAVTCVSLAVFVSLSQPHGGNASPSGHAWVTAIVATAGVTALLTVLGMSGSPARRAALMASATGILWALVATFIKATTETLSEFGVAGTFVRWPVYALAGAGLAASVLDQVALHVGPLSVSQPFLVIVDPIASIALSVWVFDETFTPDAFRLVFSVLSFAAMCVSVTMLVRTAPATMEPTLAGTMPG